MKKIIFATIFSLLLLPIAGFTAATQESFQAAFDAADAARQNAAAAGHEWRDTKKMLDQAQKLADEGQFDEAQALAEQAQLQGEAATVQAKQQAEIWMDSVPK